MRAYLWLIPLLPLLGVLINAWFGHRLPRRVSGAVACLVVFGSFVLGVAALIRLIGMPPGQRIIYHKLFPWISTGGFESAVALMYDPLSAVMVCVVTGVGFLIHVYSLGYMAHDPRYPRFFAYMNLFTFAMLMLVLADNFLLMFVGWEGVGLCSYLLIGFWFERKSASDAGMKAFIVNRVGDFGFLLGMMFIFAVFGSLRFHDVFKQVAADPATLTLTVTGICLLLFVGATGKSAQIPLYVWLPDAMEGPTPVSALIHAATMVTAGVYMVARCWIMFLNAPLALTVVACIGALTALFAATIALVQNDIKRVLAYSTISQLGYMFMACGAGVFAAGVFHLMTHAFFKALLFLGAGSVMHAMSDDTDIRRMGGLMKWLPVTGVTFWVGTLAISGIPPFSGFFSKDEIIWSSLAGPMGSWVFWVFGVVTAALTAFYMARLTFKVFHGQPRMSGEQKHHLHESPPSMAWVLILLAVGASLAGFLNIPPAIAHLLHLPERWTAAFTKFLEPSVGTHEQAVYMLETSVGGAQIGFAKLAHGLQHNAALEFGLMGITLALAAGAILAGRWMYVSRPGTGTALAHKLPFLFRTLQNKYYLDEFYKAVIVRPGMALGNALWRGFDVLVIEGIVNGIAIATAIISRLFRVFQTGYVRNYAAGILAGAILIIWVLMR